MIGGHGGRVAVTLAGSPKAWRWATHHALVTVARDNLHCWNGDKTHSDLVWLVAFLQTDSGG